MNGGTSLERSLSGSSTNPAQTARKRVTILEPTTGQLPPLKKKKVDDSDERDSDEDGNGIENDQDLENFRKQAIWREMREYKRKFERSQRQVELLDQQRTAYEARLSAVDLSWELLVKEADLILPSTSTAPNGHSHNASSPSVSDPSLTDEALVEALAQRTFATKALLERLASLHPQSGSGSTESSVDELQKKCKDLMEESLLSQESLRLLKVKHESTLHQLTKTHEDLLRAEKKFDRVQSSTVAVVEGRIQSQQQQVTTTTAAPLSVPFESNGSPSPGGIGSNGASPHPEHVTPGSGGLIGSALELNELRHLVESRARDIEELRGERVALKFELDTLKSKLVDLPEDIIAESAPFKLLQSHIQTMMGDYEAKKNELDKALKEADGMRELQENFRQQVVADTTEQVNDIQSRFNAKEADLARIRSQREDFRLEATELRTREAEKVKSLDELKTLAESRHERIEAFDSQVRRLKMFIAAKEGDGTTVEILAAGEEGVKDLQARLKSAEELLLAMRDQLRSYAHNSSVSNGQNVIIKSENDVRVELAKCKEQLQKLEDLVGPDGTPQVSELVERLTASEENVKSLEVQLKAQDHATNMLYGEIDRLSTAWSTLDEQNSAKVFSLVGLEEKVQRLNAEKAKADSRYFATLRAKESIAAENAVLNKMSEKQQRAVESATESRHSVGQQIHQLEKEITLHQQNVRLFQEALSLTRREKADLNMRNEQNAKHLTELNNALQERIKQAEIEAASRKRLEEQSERLERELAVAKETSSSSSSTDTVEVRTLKRDNEDLTKMLSCSTCKIRFKTNIINRCGHLFCKECIEARLANRQRKCPTCGIAFGKDDVSPVYF